MLRTLPSFPLIDCIEDSNYSSSGQEVAVADIESYLVRLSASILLCCAPHLLAKNCRCHPFTDYAAQPQEVNVSLPLSPSFRASKFSMKVCKCTVDDFALARFEHDFQRIPAKERFYR